MIKQSLLAFSKPIVNPMTNYILSKYYTDKKELKVIDQQQNILILAPHVDDETIGLGGTIAQHAANNCDIQCVVLTDGASSNSTEETDQLKQMRKKEMEMVQQILGITNIEFWDFPDGELQVNLAAVALLKEKIMQFQPDIIYCPTIVDAHPDHLATAEILKHTLAHTINNKITIRLYEINCPLPKRVINCVIDISEQFDKKLQAIAVFESQAIAFDGFILLAKMKRHLTNQQALAIETFLEMTAEQFVQSANQLFTKHHYQQFHLTFKQANRTQTLLWALFQNYNNKTFIYEQILEDNLCGEKIGKRR